MLLHPESFAERCHPDDVSDSLRQDNGGPTEAVPLLLGTRRIT